MFNWIALIALVRVRPAISQLVKFNLQDLQLMNNIEENIASEGASPSNPLWTWTIRYGIAIRQHWHRRGIQETTTNGHDLGQTLKNPLFLVVKVKRWSYRLISRPFLDMAGFGWVGLEKRGIAISNRLCKSLCLMKNSYFSPNGYIECCHLQKMKANIPSSASGA